jgi:hypothetical protein
MPVGHIINWLFTSPVNLSSTDLGSNPKGYEVFSDLRKIYGDVMTIYLGKYVIYIDSRALGKAKTIWRKEFSNDVAIFQSKTSYFQRYRDCFLLAGPYRVLVLNSADAIRQAFLKDDLSYADRQEFASCRSEVLKEVCMSLL